MEEEAGTISYDSEGRAVKSVVEEERVCRSEQHR